MIKQDNKIMAQDIQKIKARPISIVGLMGVGKTTIGRRLAKRLDLPFYDSDDEIEFASGRTIKGYFKEHGEEAFRAGERKVITRILGQGSMVLSTGGGAFIPEKTRTVLRKNSLTVWLKADFDTVMERVNRQRNKRPLLDVENPEAVMRKLMDARYPLYAQAHITVKAEGSTHSQTVGLVIEALKHYHADTV
ncbi:MAG: shikimate kinase [Robiginitomaculum sp.]